LREREKELIRVRRKISSGPLSRSGERVRVRVCAPL
jgi:hypothetical protein